MQEMAGKGRLTVQQILQTVLCVGFVFAESKSVVEMWRQVCV
jgi:hypothetical protein